MQLYIAGSSVGGCTYLSIIVDFRITGLSDMIVTKSGNKKYVTVSNVKIYQGTCNDCDAQFEIQEGELYLLRGPELNRPMNCPYCRRYHTDYTFRELRTAMIPAARVINPSEDDETYTVTEDQVEDWAIEFDLASLIG